MDTHYKSPINDTQFSIVASNLYSDNKIALKALQKITVKHTINEHDQFINQHKPDQIHFESLKHSPDIGYLIKNKDQVLERLTLIPVTAKI